MSRHQNVYTLICLNIKVSKQKKCLNIKMSKHEDVYTSKCLNIE
jgi:hypothetical protein